MCSDLRRDHGGADCAHTDESRGVLDVAALSSVAVALPTAGQRFDPDAIGVDGIAVPGVYRDGDRQIWIALKPGAHTVKLIGHLPAADSIQLLFPQVPRMIAVNGEGWRYRASMRVGCLEIRSNCYAAARRVMTRTRRRELRNSHHMFRCAASLRLIWIGRSKRR